MGMLGMGVPRELVMVVEVLGWESGGVCVCREGGSVLMEAVLDIMPV